MDLPAQVHFMWTFVARWHNIDRYKLVSVLPEALSHDFGLRSPVLVARIQNNYNVDQDTQYGLGSEQ